MQIKVTKGAAESATLAVDLVAGALRAKPDLNFGLATGATMVGVYLELVHRHQIGELSFAKTKAYLLDDYVGLDADDPRAFASVVEEKFCDLVDIRSESVVAPNSQATDLEAEANKYETLVCEAQIDFQLLGIGRNGHIGFNEPGTAFDSKTRLACLSLQTRQDNAGFFSSVDKVPKRAITQGIGTILRAKKIVLIANGAHKATAIRDAVCGFPSEASPASALQNHSDVTVIADREAASMLNSC